MAWSRASHGAIELVLRRADESAAAKVEPKAHFVVVVSAGARGSYAVGNWVDSWGVWTDERAVARRVVWWAG